MEHVSVTITGLALIIIAQFVPAEELETVTEAVGIIIAWYGRWRHGDISVVGLK